MTGHSLGATGVQEAIYCLLMMKNNFLAASANISVLDPNINKNEVLIECMENVEIDTILSNSFGFGGTNATLALSKFQD